MAYIEWDDADGTGVLTPHYPAGPARRFKDFTPDVQLIGPVRYGLGSAQRFPFVFREDQIASLAIPGLLPNQHALFLRFKTWALKGGTFFVYCEDADAHVYECRLAEDSMPEMRLTDAALLEYTVTVTIKNLSDAPLLCDYRG